MSGNKNKKIAINYFGGKFTWVDYLYSYFPDHIHFIDVFCGSMAVTLNKPYSEIDTANDINSEVVNFFRVLRESPDELLRQLKMTPVSREEYNNCWYSDSVNDPLEKARRFYVRARQSFFGLGIQRKNKGWHMVKTISRSNFGETVSKWHNGIEKLIPVIDKLTHIQIENDGFRNLIPKMDFPGAFFYCDPPYPLEARASKNDYCFDFEDQDHRDLAKILHGINGKAMISSYNCRLMQELYSDWYFVKFPKKKNNIRSGDVEECIWMNYEPMKNKNYSLFN